MQNKDREKTISKNCFSSSMHHNCHGRFTQLRASAVIPSPSCACWLASHFKLAKLKTVLAFVNLSQQVMYNGKFVRN